MECDQSAKTTRRQCSIWSDLEQCPNERWNSEKEKHSMINDENVFHDRNRLRTEWCSSSDERRTIEWRFHSVKKTIDRMRRKIFFLIVSLQSMKIFSTLRFSSQPVEKHLHQRWRERKWSFHPREESPCCSSDLNRSVWRTFSRQKNQIDNEISPDKFWRNCFSVPSPQLVIGSLIAFPSSSSLEIRWIIANHPGHVFSTNENPPQSFVDVLLSIDLSIGVEDRNEKSFTCWFFWSIVSFDAMQRRSLVLLVYMNKMFPAAVPQCPAKNASKQIGLPVDLAENEVQISMDRDLFRWSIFSLISSIIMKERCDRLEQLFGIARSDLTERTLPRRTENCDTPSSPVSWRAIPLGRESFDRSNRSWVEGDGEQRSFRTESSFQWDDSIIKKKRRHARSSRAFGQTVSERIATDQREEMSLAQILIETMIDRPEESLSLSLSLCRGTLINSWSTSRRDRSRDDDDDEERLFAVEGRFRWIRSDREKFVRHEENVAGTIEWSSRAGEATTLQWDRGEKGATRHQMLVKLNRSSPWSTRSIYVWTLRQETSLWTNERLREVRSFVELSPTLRKRLTSICRRRRGRMKPSITSRWKFEKTLQVMAEDVREECA